MNKPPELFIVSLKTQLPNGKYFHPAAAYWRDLNVILLDAESPAWQHLERDSELSKKAMAYIVSIITHELMHWLLNRDISDVVSDQFDFLDEKCKITKRTGSAFLSMVPSPTAPDCL